MINNIMEHAYDIGYVSKLNFLVFFLNINGIHLNKYSLFSVRPAPMVYLSVNYMLTFWQCQLKVFVDLFLNTHGHKLSTLIPLLKESIIFVYPH